MKSWEAIKALTENPKLKFASKNGYEMSCDSRGILIYTWKRGESSGMSGNLRIRDYTPYDADEWELVPQPVSFMEAVKAYNEGKTIRRESNGGYKFFSACGLKCANATFTASDILEGTWYIEKIRKGGT